MSGRNDVAFALLMDVEVLHLFAVKSILIATALLEIVEYVSI
jgi:hypothetical protein